MACAQLIPGDPLSTPHRISRDGIPWERGRPARIRSLWPPLSFSAMLQAPPCVPWERGRSLWPPLSFSAMLQAATLRRKPHRPGKGKARAPFPVVASGGDGRGCDRLGAGGTPALPAIIVRAGRPRSQEASIP